MDTWIVWCSCLVIIIFYVYNNYCRSLFCICSTLNIQTFCIIGFTFHRLLLTYLRWRISQRQINALTKPKLDSNNSFEKFMSSNHNIYYDYRSVLFLSFITISSITMYIAIVAWYNFGPWGICHLSLFIIGGCIILNNLCHKVKEGIGSSYECFILLIVYIVYSILTVILSRWNIDVLLWIGVNIQGLFVLFSPIVTIYIYNNTNTTDTINKIENNVTTNNAKLPINLDLQLFVFLEQQHHYDAFVEYLGHCFATENIMV